MHNLAPKAKCLQTGLALLQLEQVRETIPALPSLSPQEWRMGAMISSQISAVLAQMAAHGASSCSGAMTKHERG